MVEPPAAAAARESMGAPECEARRPMTPHERSAILRVRNRLQRLNSVRRSPDAYAHHFRQAIESIDLRGNSPEAQNRFFILLGTEILKQSLTIEIGTDSTEWREFERTTFDVLFMGALSMRRVIRATAGVHLWIERSLNPFDVMTGEEGGPRLTDADRMRRVVKSEALRSYLAMLSRSLAIAADSSAARVREEVNLYLRQPAIALAGGGVVVGTMMLAGPFVSMVGSIGLVGTVGASGVVGGLGGGAASVIIEQSRNFWEAYRRSLRSSSSISCEFWSITSGRSDGLIGAFAAGVIEGATIGTMAATFGLIVPTMTLRLVHGAVALATVYEGGHAVYNAARALATWRAIRNLEAAVELAEAGRDDLARLRFLQAQQLSAAAHHALKAALVGMVLPHAPRELTHALRASRAEVVAMIARSADNAGVAGEILQDMVR